MLALYAASVSWRSLVNALPLICADSPPHPEQLPLASVIFPPDTVMVTVIVPYLSCAPVPVKVPFFRPLPAAVVGEGAARTVARVPAGVAAGGAPAVRLAVGPGPPARPTRRPARRTGRYPRRTRPVQRCRSDPPLRRGCRPRPRPVNGCRTWRRPAKRCRRWYRRRRRHVARRIPPGRAVRKRRIRDVGSELERVDVDLLAGVPTAGAGSCGMQPRLGSGALICHDCLVRAGAAVARRRRRQGGAPLTRRPPESVGIAVMSSVVSNGEVPARPGQPQRGPVPVGVSVVAGNGRWSVRSLATPIPGTTGGRSWAGGRSAG